MYKQLHAVHGMFASFENCWWPYNAEVAQTRTLVSKHLYLQVTAHVHSYLWRLNSANSGVTILGLVVINDSLVLTVALVG